MKRKTRAYTPQNEKTANRFETQIWKLAKRQTNGMEMELNAAFESDTDLKAMLDTEKSIQDRIKELNQQLYDTKEAIELRTYRITREYIANLRIEQRD